MKRYKAVFLDWDDTIGDWHNAEVNALRDVYQMFHIDELYDTPDEYIAAYKPYNLSLWRKYGRGEITKELLHFDRFRHPLLVTENDLFRGRQKDELALEMGDRFLQLTNHYFTLMPDAENVVRILASRYPLTIISNGFSEIQHYKFSHSGLQDCFTHLLISDEIGINKPNSEIFDIALKKNSVKPEEAVMVGDSYDSDIAGAKSAGIDQIWLHDGDTSQTATYIVPKLKDILKIL